jgi:hypothetical protein
MKQRKSVQQLERCPGVDDPCISRGATSPDEPPIGKHRSQPLTPTHHQTFEFIERRGKVSVESGPALTLGGQKCAQSLVDTTRDIAD